MNEQTIMRKKLYSLMGDLPPKNRPISAELLSTEEKGNMIIETLSLDLNGIERVPAFFVKPKGAKGKLPTILFCHSWNKPDGKEEMFKQKERLQRPYAEEFTEMGYNILALDMWSFGQRNGNDEQELFRSMLLNGQVMWGMMVYDSLRGIDYLKTRKDVDMKRLATLGMSMGSTMAWWVAALDTRIKVCADVCCMSELNELEKIKGLKFHSIYYFVPKLKKYFTTSQINSLIAPRAHICEAGRRDCLTPESGLKIIDKELKKVYKELKASDKWLMETYDCEHYELKEMRDSIVKFFKKHL